MILHFIELCCYTADVTSSPLGIYISAILYAISQPAYLPAVPRHTLINRYQAAAFMTPAPLQFRHSRI